MTQNNDTFLTKAYALDKIKVNYVPTTDKQTSIPSPKRRAKAAEVQ
jgi:hypothetical protein